MKLKFVEWNFAEGCPIEVGATADADESGYRIVPRSFVLSVRWSGGGYVLNKPVGIRIEHDGESDYATIPDPTRTAQYLFALVYVFILFWLIRRR